MRAGRRHPTSSLWRSLSLCSERAQGFPLRQSLVSKISQVSIFKAKSWMCGESQPTDLLNVTYYSEKAWKLWLRQAISCCQEASVCDEGHIPWKRRKWAVGWKGLTSVGWKVHLSHHVRCEVKFPQCSEVLSPQTLFYKLHSDSTELEK